MKRGLALYILFFIYTISNFSCKKDKNSTIIPVQLSGTWRWIYTYQDLPLGPTNPVTPLNSGVNEIMVFNADKKWTKTQNNILVDSGTYSLGHGTYAAYPGAFIFNYDSIGLYKNNMFAGWDSYEVLHDTLVFMPYLSGRFSSYFSPGSGSKWFTRQ
jgi:hypothetical protein